MMAQKKPESLIRYNQQKRKGFNPINTAVCISLTAVIIAHGLWIVWSVG